MNVKKIFLPLALLMTLAVVGCNQNSGNNGSGSGNTPAPTPGASESEVEAPLDDDGEPYVLPRNWTEGAKANNSDGKEYIQLNDAAAKKVGVKISIQNYTVSEDDNADTELTGDGKIDPVNQKDAALTYKVKAPKAASYQMVLRGKSKSDALSRSLSARSFTVQLNGEDVDVMGDRTPLTDEQSDFVGVPSMYLTGAEDTIRITCCDYRIQFDVESFVIFSQL